MQNVMLNNGVEVNETGKCGRGVFATKSFKKGETIEISPVIVFPPEQDNCIEKSVIKGYTFRWGKRGRFSALAFGCGSFYNHSYDANAKYQGDYEKKTMEFIAVKDIEQGEEVSINYNGTPKSQKPVWFDVI